MKESCVCVVGGGKGVADTKGSLHNKGDLYGESFVYGGCLPRRCV